MRKTVLHHFFMIVLMFSVLGCAAPENKNQPQMPSDSVKAAVEQSLNTYAATISQGVIDTSLIFTMLKDYLNAHKDIYGAALAMLPIVKDNDTFRFSPYVYRFSNGYNSIYLEKSYDYTKDDWYSAPVNSLKGCWTQPYFDEGGGNVWMITYSVPVYTPDSALFGVITSDIEIKK